MQVFKAACRIILRHPIYVGLYLFVLSMIGVFMVSALGEDTTYEYQSITPTIAVIDRDRSDLSQGLSAFLEKRGELVEVEDSKRGLQDATAQGQASYIMILPDKFEEDFLNDKASKIETIISYDSINGSLTDELVNQYLAVANLHHKANPSMKPSDLIKASDKAMENSIDVDVVSFGDTDSLSSQYFFFMKFSAYPIITGGIVCIAVLMIGFNNGRLRKRNLSSPISSLAFSMQTAAACVFLSLLSWLWINVLSFILFHDVILNGSPLQYLLMLLCSLVLTSIPLSIGLLTAQLSKSESVVNAVGNILGLVFCFLGGLWISKEMLGDTVIQIAHFTPAFWYSEAIDKIATIQGELTQATLVGIAGDIGIMLLFAGAIFAVSLVMGRLRLQSSSGGENADAVTRL